MLIIKKRITEVKRFFEEIKIKNKEEFILRLNEYYKSDGEYYTGKYLESRDIDFYTQINYKGTRNFTDFYIPSIDTYFKLMGIKENNYLDKRNILNKTKYKIIWSSDPKNH